ncbi:hypothetical protein M0R19_03850 [Candidatus Pacearchaeota archaeon]|nr:hypothetical protein [Candidatus Pacearchaeota archaeon]
MKNELELGLKYNLADGFYLILNNCSFNLKERQYNMNKYKFCKHKCRFNKLYKEYPTCFEGGEFNLIYVFNDKQLYCVKRDIYF